MSTKFKRKRGIGSANDARVSNGITDYPVYTLNNDIVLPKFELDTEIVETVIKQASKNKNSNPIAVKMYKRKPYINLTIDYIDEILGMTIKARKLFSYIIKHSRNTNKIELSTKDVMKIIGTEYPNVVTNTIKELILHDIISKTNEKNGDKHIYCINHNVFFNGNYTEFINTCKVMFKKTETSDTNINDNESNKNKDESYDTWEYDLYY